ncbi:MULTISPECIES: lysozyme inhibitor LprI family protein [unclassified Sphingomonas]|uniref:lysozyme inhibitor LprI family protein n=1 Tax=unclassified Sphingomonas TaxID=196159 RepID=UPI0006FD0057|nr:MULTISPECIES: lysozyme inhibitor LprI family protein [unclassified Sphingomonas]KQM66747.1 hypothetical protein ASE65_01260 [Sphingomonas sp. Leaf16]KQN17695.1 hypothetical protein ASE81_00640 [Sphingomonas sp. Leaf29]KQN23558.1 hypothetical protein ASE83_03520 [Sphingomonas sp. Leaf32]
MLLSLLLLADAVGGNCAKAPTQVAADRCAESGWQVADRDMSREWRVARSAMQARDARDPTRGGGFGYAAALLESQRAWLKFRDTQCVLEGGVNGRNADGGDARSLVRFACMERMTIARTQALRHLRGG